MWTLVVLFFVFCCLLFATNWLTEKESANKSERSIGQLKTQDKTLCKSCVRRISMRGSQLAVKWSGFGMDWSWKVGLVWFCLEHLLEYMYPREAQASKVGGWGGGGEPKWLRILRMSYSSTFAHGIRCSIQTCERGNEANISYVCTAMLGTAVDPLTYYIAKCVLTTWAITFLASLCMPSSTSKLMAPWCGHWLCCSLSFVVCCLPPTD